jgi:hypothetical protein
MRSPNEGPDDGASAGVESWSIASNPTETLSRADFLSRYQVVVLGRNAEIFLSDAAVERLRQWIARDGGALVCYRGAPTPRVQQQLANLLPVKWEPKGETRFHPQLTEPGKDARWLAPGGRRNDEHGYGSLPALARTTVAAPASPLTIVLATAGPEVEASPVVAYQPYGGGKVVAIEGAGMWRWAFLPPQYREYDSAYRGLWQNLLQWLISNTGLLPGRNMALRTDRATFRASEETSATLLLREPGAAGPPQVQLTGGALAAPRMITPVPVGDAPGAYRASFGRLSEGMYQARVVGAQEADRDAETAFDVRDLSEEQLDLNARPKLMEQIATESGGAVLTQGGADELIQRFRARTTIGSLERVTKITAWDRWWVLAGIVGALAGAWKIRRSGGLV